MAEINVKKPFTLLTNDGQMLKFVPGKQTVSDDLASHWWVKAHSFDEPGSENFAQAAVARANEAEATAKAAHDEWQRLQAEADAAVEAWENHQAAVIRAQNAGLEPPAPPNLDSLPPAAGGVNDPNANGNAGEAPLNNLTDPNKKPTVAEMLAAGYSGDALKNASDYEAYANGQADLDKAAADEAAKKGKAK